MDAKLSLMLAMYPRMQDGPFKNHCADEIISFLNKEREEIRKSLDQIDKRREHLVEQDESLLTTIANLGGVPTT